MSRPPSRPGRKRWLAVALTSASGLALGGLAALVAAPSASAATSVAQATTYMSSEVIKPGASRVVGLSSVPTNARTATFTISGRWAWRPTSLSLCAGTQVTDTCKARPVLTTPTQSLGLATTTLDVSSAGGRVVVYNSVASVRVTLTLVSYTVDSAGTPSGKPGPDNTGVPAGTHLAPYYGDLTVTEPNKVIDALEIHGVVIIKAANVVIKRTRILGRPVTYDQALITVNGPGWSVRVEDSELFAEQPSHHMRGIIGYNFSLNRVDLHHVIDQILIVGDNVNVTNSWFHDNLYYTNDPNYGGKSSHDDNIQISIGKNLRFTKNTLSDSHNASLMVTQDRGHVSDLTYSGNYVDDGACSVNLAQKSYGPMYRFTIRDNVFSRTQRNVGCAIVSPLTTTSLMNVGGNVWTDGKPVSVSRGQ